MRHLPQPPIVASAFSGFVVGVLVTLLATGVLHRSSGAASPPPTPVPSRPLADNTLYARVRAIVNTTLGPPYSPHSDARLVAVSVRPTGEVAVPPHRSTTTIATYRTVHIVFRLHDHPLGRSWRLKEAKGDVFQVLRALYTSGLPIYNVEIAGVFPIHVGRSIVTRQVMVGFINHLTALKIPWARWGRDHEAQVWSLLNYKHTDGSFA